MFLSLNEIDLRENQITWISLKLFKETKWKHVALEEEKKKKNDLDWFKTFALHCAAFFPPDNKILMLHESKWKHPSRTLPKQFS